MYGIVKSEEREMKMIWEVTKNDSRSFLVGTAHFFSHSFRSSLRRYIGGARHVLVEGPLDRENMNRVVESGFESDGRTHIFDHLDRKVIARITDIFNDSKWFRKIPFIILRSGHVQGEDSIYDALQGMKPWMAFFTLWHKFTGRLGWKHSVDMEAYAIALEMGKEVIPLETIEEQIAVLDGIPRERVVDFINQIDEWERYARDYSKYYLAGDLDNLKSLPGKFPTLRFPVIGERDKILYRRMKQFMEEGDTVAFVGAPHIRGINELFRLDGSRSTSIVQLQECDR